MPRELYDEVFELTAAIAQPDAPNEAAVDSGAAEEAKGQLVALFERRQAAGTPDPFLTETLADFTDDAAEAVRLYRLALEQSATFPGEPTHTKRQGLVVRLVELGRSGEAQAELTQAKREAFAAGDTDTINELNETEQGMAVQQRAPADATRPVGS